MTKTYTENKAMGNYGEGKVLDKLKARGNKILFHAPCGVNHSAFDIEIENKTGEKIRLEVKTEDKNTGNSFIEFIQSGQASGIITTKAKYYVVYILPTDRMYRIEVDVLKDYIMRNYIEGVHNKQKIEFWNITMGFLVPLIEFEEM